MEKADMLKINPDNSGKINNKNLILSIILPIYNEEGNIDELFSRIIEVMNAIPLKRDNYEIIFIDDASTDLSREKLNNISRKYGNIHVYHHIKRKFHAMTINTGFNHTGNSKYTILMNADLQYDPIEIPEFLIKAKEGYDIINGWRKNRADSFLKNFSSKIFNILMKIFFHSPVSDNASNFALYKTAIIKNLKLEINDQRYLINILYYGERAKKITEIPVRHYSRKYGISKYPLQDKLLLGFWELLSKWKKIVIKKETIEFLRPKIKNLKNSYDLSIVIPIKNEVDNIIDLLNQISSIFINNKGLNPEIIIIDDNSTDETENVISEFTNSHYLKNNLRVFRNRLGKYTVGRAIRYGINNTNSDIILTMDGDLSHDPKEAYEIYTYLKKGHDLVIGGRYLYNQEPFEPKTRYKISKLFNFFAQFLYGERIRDYTTGFRGFTRDLVDSVQLKSDGFEFHLEINAKLTLKSENPIEIPIHYKKRTAGESKLKYIREFPRYLLRLIFSRFI